MTRILLTRPKLDSERTRRLVEAAGHTSFAVPLTQIELLSVDFPSIESIDALIFVSRHAVDGFMEALKNDTPHAWPPCFCIGESTGKRLLEYGVASEWPSQENSEGLFELLSDRIEPDMASILYLKGEGGRAWLPEQLSKQYRLTCIDLYRRILLSKLTSDEHKSVVEFDPQWISINNGEALQTLLHLFSKDWVEQRRLCLPGKRLEGLARSEGLTNVLVLPDAKPETLVHQLKAHYQE